MIESKSIDSTARREALWNLYREHYFQFRHYETQRSAVAAALVAIIGLVLSVIAFDDGITSDDIPLTLFIVVVAIFGAFFASKQYERSSKFAILIKHLELDIDSTLEGSPIGDVKARARQEHHNYFLFSRKIKVHQLWTVLYVLIAIIGLWLSYLAAR